MRILRELWQDEGGAISAMSMLLLVTLVALGAIVGLTAIRDQIVQELGDISLALENLNQSVGTFVDTGPGGAPLPVNDSAGTAPACLSLSVSAQHES